MHSSQLRQCAHACFQSSATMGYHTAAKPTDEASAQGLSLLINSLQFMNQDMIEAIVNVALQASEYLQSGDLLMCAEILRPVLVGCQEKIPETREVLSCLLSKISQSVARLYFQNQRFAEALSCSELSFRSYALGGNQESTHSSCCWFEIGCLRVLAASPPRSIAEAMRNACESLLRGAPSRFPAVPCASETLECATLNRNVAVVMSMCHLAEEHATPMEDLGSSTNSYESTLMQSLIMNMHKGDSSDDLDLAFDLHLLAVKLMSTGRHSEATWFLAEETRLRRSGPMDDLMSALARLGHCYQAVKADDAALCCYRTILDAKLGTVLSASMGARGMLTHILFDVGVLCAKKAARAEDKAVWHKQALESFEICLSIHRCAMDGTEETGAIFKLLFSIGTVHGEIGEVNLAVARLNEAAACAPDASSKASALRSLAIVSGEITAYERCLAVVSAENLPDMRARILIEYGQLLKKVGRIEEALKSFEEAASWMRTKNVGGKHRRLLAEVLNGIGFLELARSNSGKASAFFAEATLLSGRNVVASAAAA